MLINNKRTQLLSWRSEGLVSSSDLEDAFEATKSNPSCLDWQNFLSRVFLWFGAIAISTGVIFFFAYNWQDISRMSKFALVESILVAATFLFYRFVDKHNIATAVLFAIAILTGSLLALVGQTYQTGADPWQLFAVWAVFITPWVVISNTTSLWTFWILLINLSLLLYFTISARFWGILLTFQSGARVFVVLNSLLLVAFEWKSWWSKTNLVGQTVASKTIAHNRIFHPKRVCQLLVVLAGLAISTLALGAIFGSKKSLLDLFFYIVWGGLVYYHYRYKSRDLFIIAAGTLSVCILLISVLTELFGSSFNELYFLLVGFAIIGLSTSAGIWLKNLAKEFHRLDDLSLAKSGESNGAEQPENKPSGDH